MNLVVNSLCDSAAGDSIPRSISDVILSHGYRVAAHDRRGHGRSDQTDTGNDMDTYVADVATLVQAPGLRDAIHIGHSTGGGEVARYVAHSAQGDQNAPVRSRFALLKLVGWVSNQAVGVEELFGGFRREVQT